MTKSTHQKYLEEVKKIQKTHLSKEQWNGKERINEDWEKEWLPFIKYDNQWDWNYMLDLIIYKLELMRTYFKYYCIHEDQDKIINQIDEAIVLGKRIYNQESAKEEYYYQPWLDYHKKYSTPYAYVYERINNDGSEFCKRGKLLTTIEMPKDDELDFKSRKSSLNKWLKENNKHEYKDVTVFYRSEWNNFSKIRTLISKHILNKCKREYTKDKKRFFKIICNNMEGWWD